MSDKEEAAEGITRRELMRYLGYSAAATTFLTGFKAIQFSFRYREMKEKRDHQQDLDSKVSDSELKVEHFSSQIVEASARIHERNDASAYLIASYFFGNFAGHALFRKLSIVKKLSAGATAGILGSLIDNYSTYKAFEVTSSKKFSEYGLHNYFFESNNTLSQHPTGEEILNGVSNTASAAALFGVLYPPFGTGLFATSLAIANDHTKFRTQILSSYKIGEHVESMITAGKGRSQITEYLSTLSPKDIVFK